MKKMYVLLMGLLCCDKEASKTQPKDAQQQRKGCCTACQDHHAQHEEILGKCYNGCPDGHLQKPTKNSSDFEEEKDYKDAQQAISDKAPSLHVDDNKTGEDSCELTTWKFISEEAWVHRRPSCKTGVQPYDDTKRCLGG